MIAEPGSFRDPHSFVAYTREGTLVRYLHDGYLPHFNHLISSGLYNILLKQKNIVRHELTDKKDYDAVKEYGTVLRPEKIPFISYPYEWSFSQLKAAALLTLSITKLALEHGMILKDATAYNIQFIGYRPVLIDTASFEIYEDQKPWNAYQQFCQHFLAPLALCAYVNVHLRKIALTNIDGIPLELCVSLLPFKAKFSIGLYFHLFMHSRMQVKHQNEHTPVSNQLIELPKKKLLSLLSHLEITVKKLKWNMPITQWSDYYTNTNYTEIGKDQKHKIVSEYVDSLHCKTAIDIGANNGEYSTILSGKGIYTVALDMDEVSVENNYVRSSKNSNQNLLPLQSNIINPTPGIGWNNKERKSFLERASADLILALAIIHHLVITFDIPLKKIAELFCRIAKNLIVEFVPSQDDKVQQILKTKPHQKAKYSQELFESAFNGLFIKKRQFIIEGNNRIIYLYERQSQENN